MCNSSSIFACELFLLSTIISLFSIFVKQCRLRIGGMRTSIVIIWLRDDCGLGHKLCKVPLYISRNIFLYIIFVLKIKFHDILNIINLLFFLFLLISEKILFTISSLISQFLINIII